MSNYEISHRMTKLLKKNKKELPGGMGIHGLRVYCENYIHNEDDFLILRLI